MALSYRDALDLSDELVQRYPSLEVAAKYDEGRGEWMVMAESANGSYVTIRHECDLQEGNFQCYSYTLQHPGEEISHGASTKLRRKLFAAIYNLL